MVSHKDELGRREIGMAKWHSLYHLTEHKTNLLDHLPNVEGSVRTVIYSKVSIASLTELEVASGSRIKP